MSEVDSVITQLQQLEELDLRYNTLANFPSHLHPLPRLQTLQLRGNQITRLDSIVARLQPLMFLDLSANPISEGSRCSLPYPGYVPY